MMTTCSPRRLPHALRWSSSGDRDLLDIGTFRDIGVLNAAEALRTLSA
jgi:hypothetical protein